MLYFQADPNYLVHKCAAGTCVCDDGKSIAVWGDRLRLLSPWWIAKCSCFKILLGHSPRVAKGCLLMYCFSWDWVCVCSSLKVCNKFTYKIRQQGLFLHVQKQVVQRRGKRKKSLCSLIRIYNRSYSHCCIFSLPCFGRTVWLCN